MTQGILFATPCYGGMVTEHFHSSMIKLAWALKAAGVEHDFLTLRNESLITRARNTCAATFLRGEFSHLMFIDSDIEFQPDDVAKLWNLDVDVAVGCYRMKEPGSKFALWVKGQLIEHLDELLTPVEVDYAGTGFMLIRRNVFERLREAHPMIEHEEGNIGTSWAFFDTGVYDRVYLSEDYLFCRRWRELGGTIHADPTVRLGHVGQFVYR